MGWSEGESLGKENTGIQEPVGIGGGMFMSEILEKECVSSKNVNLEAKDERV